MLSLFGVSVRECLFHVAIMLPILLMQCYVNETDETHYFNVLVMNKDEEKYDKDGSLIRKA